MTALAQGTSPGRPAVHPGIHETNPIHAMDSPLPTPSGITDKDVRMWSMLCHLAALAGLIVPSVGALVGPLVVWLLKRNDHPTIDAHGKESLNFQLSIFLYTWGIGILGIATTFILIGFAFLFLAFVIGVLGLVFAVIASVKVSNGEAYRYPFTIRFLSYPPPTPPHPRGFVACPRSSAPRASPTVSPSRLRTPSLRWTPAPSLLRVAHCPQGRNRHHGSGCHPDWRGA